MKKWLSAMRLRTLPLAASSVITGSALAWQEAPSPIAILLLALLTTFLLQILSNLANDYGDFRSGIDNDQRVGPKRAMQSGAITKDEMTKALIICSAAAFISGLLLLWRAFGASGDFSRALIFLMIGVLAIIAAFKYTVGKNPYGYKGLGDIAVFFFFGIVGVGGTYYLQSMTWNNIVLLPAAAIGLFSAAVLNLNNLRDHENDKAGGKMTMVVKLGFAGGKVYHIILIALAVICTASWAVMQESSSLVYLPLLACVLQIILLSKVLRTMRPADLDPELKKVALLTFLYSLLIFIPAIL